MFLPLFCEFSEEKGMFFSKYSVGIDLGVWRVGFVSSLFHSSTLQPKDPTSKSHTWFLEPSKMISVCFDTI